MPWLWQPAGDTSACVVSGSLVQHGFFRIPHGEILLFFFFSFAPFESQNNFLKITWPICECVVFCYLLQSSMYNFPYLGFFECKYQLNRKPWTNVQKSRLNRITLHDKSDLVSSDNMMKVHVFAKILYEF